MYSAGRRKQMNMTLRQQITEKLETMIDVYTLASLLDMLAEVSSEKADHLRSNWQDERTAVVWDRMAARLLNASEVARKDCQ
jgi:hypothetical protein